MRTWSTLKKLIWLKKTVLSAASWTYKTVTGSLIHILDALAAPVSALSVAINPVQDLHGYDNPWPAGGGANKLPPYDADTKTLGTTTCTFDGNGKCTLKAVADSTARTFTFDVTPFTTPTGTCYMHLLNSAVNSGVTTSFRDASDNAIGGTFSLSSSPNRIIELTEEQKGQVVSKIRVYKNAAQTDFELTFSPMLLETNAATTTYIPYSNICPISGRTQAKMWREATYDPTANPALTIDLDGTVYGGTLDVLTGTLTARPYYASYNGEALVGPWVSSMDKYAAGATPTTGAQVVDLGGTPTTVQLDPAQLATLAGENNVWADTGDTTMTYMAQGG